MKYIVDENERKKLKDILDGKENIKEFIEKNNIWLPGQGITFTDFCEKEKDDN